MFVLFDILSGFSCFSLHFLKCVSFGLRFHLFLHARWFLVLFAFHCFQVVVEGNSRVSYFSPGFFGCVLFVFFLTFSRVWPLL